MVLRVLSAQITLMILIDIPVNLARGVGLHCSQVGPTEINHVYDFVGLRGEYGYKEVESIGDGGGKSLRVYSALWDKNM